jgi:hypothetical protein
MQAQRPATFLDELEAKQDEVIAQLDELNLRIEQLLTQWTGRRDGESHIDAKLVSGEW